MLRGSRENRSFLALISNFAGVTALCFLLLASTIVAILPQMNVNSAMLSPAYAQENQETESETGPEQASAEDDTGSSDEEEQATTPPPTTDDLVVAIEANGTDTDETIGTAPLMVSLEAIPTGGEEPYDYTW
ncbi:MAG: hypothetical protein M3270_05555, partial [Thermoproteota archaeon]|nr:hypothetical protein [Thermoproteota archaeon]